MVKKGPKEKHVPIRTCIATGEKLSKFDLIRIVKNPSTGIFEIDLRNKIRARGANLKPTEEAFDLMVKKKALKRALLLEKDLSIEEYEDLKSKFLEAVEEKTFRPNNKPVRIKIPRQL